MAYLINRNPAARIECLHALVKFILSKHGLSNKFSLGSVKFNREEKNIHEFCSMLVTNSLGIVYCPFKNNPLSEAGCYLTNGVYADSTKSKEVSNSINALHALGFVTRIKDDVHLTDFGVQFASTNYCSEKMQDIISNAVLKYGPVVGALKKISEIANNGEFDIREIKIGYPVTNEAINHNGRNVIISSGSRDDSNTRTKSCILAWLTTAGFIRPKNLVGINNVDLPQCAYRAFLNRPIRSDKKYISVKQVNFINSKPFVTERPLSFKNLTKMTSALREHNQADIREVTMKYENRINSRRFAILYLLNKAYKEKCALKLSFLFSFMKKYPDLFLISETNISETITEELEIATLAGIPYDIEDEGGLVLKPVVMLNEDELLIDAPESLVELLRKTRI